MDKLDSYHLPVTGRNILKFAFPTIVMTVFNTFYTMVDGLFVSNLIGMEALSAINLTAPAIALITAISGMLATGGSAVVMKKMGGAQGTGGPAGLHPPHSHQRSSGRGDDAAGLYPDGYPAGDYGPLSGGVRLLPHLFEQLSAVHHPHPADV